MASAADLFSKLVNSSSGTSTKIRGRFSNGEIVFSFIGSVAAADPASLDIAGNEWGLKVDLTGVAIESKPIDVGLPSELALSFPSSARMFLTEFTN
jgi:hypothetical protein